LNWSKTEIEALTKIRDLHIALADAYTELIGNLPTSARTSTPTFAQRIVEVKSEVRHEVKRELNKPAQEDVEWVTGGESSKGEWEKSVDYSSPRYKELFKMIVTSTRQPVFHDGAIYWLLQDGRTIARRKKT
jgi:hypothetical protein